MPLVSETLKEWSTLCRLGIPIMVAQLSTMANAFVDAVMAGNASAEDLAAIGMGVSFWVPLSLFFIGVLSAVPTFISNASGAKQYADICPIAWQGIYIGFIGCLPIIAILWFSQPIIELFKPEPFTAEIAGGYLQALAWGMPAMALLTALRGLSDGLSHTRAYMVCTLLGTISNIPLNYALIYGYWGAPELGGVGCGWATTGANIISLAAMVIYLHYSQTYRSYRLLSTWSPPIAAKINAILKLGIPIGITLFVEVSMFAAIALFLAPLGANTVAGHQIVLNATSIVFMIPLSLGMAVMLRISYLVGEGSLKQARLVALSSLILALAIAGINAPVLFFGRNMIAQFYTDELAVIAIAGQLFVYAAIFQIVDVLQVTAINALRGYRDTRIPMWMAVISFWCICLPLGYILTYTQWLTSAPLGAKGYWLALTIALAVVAVLLTSRLLSFHQANNATKTENATIC